MSVAFYSCINAFFVRNYSDEGELRIANMLNTTMSSLLEIYQVCMHKFVRSYGMASVFIQPCRDTHHLDNLNVTD